MRRSIALPSFLLLSGALVSCTDTVNCGTGTHLDDTNTCVADTLDLGMPVRDMRMDMTTTPPPDLPPAVMCGTNTQYNATSNKCEVIAAVCLQGTTFDPAAFTCSIPMNFGTQIYTSGFTQLYLHLAQQVQTDGGIVYTALGGLGGGVTNFMNVADTTPLFLSGKPNAQFGNIPAVPVFWPEGPVSSSPTAHSTQITFGEWKMCTGTVSIYKAPPTMPTGFKEVIDLAGCPADLSFSAWNTYYTDATAVTKRVLATPAGGLPNFFVVNGAGKGHFERDLDPNVWFKSGAFINGIAHGSPTIAVPVPDLVAFPNAAMGVNVILHNDGQSNGNPGWCLPDAVDPTKCTSPASPDVYLPGRNGVTSVNAFSAFPPPMGQDVYCNGGAGACNPAPLSMLQPF